MTTHDLIRTRRIELGLTLEQVGSYVGVSKSTVKKWETGYISNMRRDKIVKLAQILQLSPIDLINTTEADFESAHDAMRAGVAEIGLVVSDIDPQIAALLKKAEGLNAQGLAKLNDYADDLSENPKYAK